VTISKNRIANPDVLGEKDVKRPLIYRSVLALAALAMLSACAKTSGNPYHMGNAYSVLPYSSQDEVQMLSTGELHYN
jgi:hypothetical protein